MRAHRSAALLARLSRPPLHHRVNGRPSLVSRMRVGRCCQPMPMSSMVADQNRSGSARARSLSCSRSSTPSLVMNERSRLRSICSGVGLHAYELVEAPVPVTVRTI